MTELFLQVVNMSISACWAILAVLLLRMLFAKAPKWIAVALWGIVAFRLICPFSLESAFSVLPSGQTVVMHPPFADTPQIDSGVPVIDNAINPSIVTDAGAVAMQIALTIGASVWMVGIAAMLLYTLFSYRVLARKVSTAVSLRENIYQSEHIDTPFVLGVFRPKIYLPFATDAHDMEYVLAHERAHLRRKDHLWKPFGFCLLALHWFNPLAWLAYVLLCRDIESACDEKVIAAYDSDRRADYSEALMHCGVRRKGVAACPLAFGETGLKTRIKKVLGYKKCALWLIILALVAGVIAAVCLLTNPESGEIMLIPDKQTVHTGYDDVYITFKSLDTNSGGYKVFNVTWHNETDQEVTFGEAYAIQRYEDGKWVSTLKGEAWANDIANIIPSNGTANHSYTTQRYDISAVGTYRLLCWFYAPDGKEYHTWIEFANEEVDTSVKSGVSAIRVENISPDDIKLCIDYTFGTGGCTVRNVGEDEGEYIGDGMIPYDGSLGKHRIMVTFGDTDMTVSLLSAFSDGKIVELNNSPIRLLAKRACPSDHGFVLYIGYDSPITATEVSEDLNVLGGTVEIPVRVGESQKSQHVF